MKRILIAAAMALGIHAVFLTARFDWLKRFTASQSTPHVMTMTLSMRQPRHAEAIKKKSFPKTPAHLTHPPEKPKPKIPEPEPPKPVPAPRPPSKASAAKAVANKTPVSEPKPADFKTTSNAFNQSSPNSAVPPPVREARPLYRNNPAPEYPSIARRRGYQGNVVLEVLVDRKGIVAKLRISKSSGYPVLDQAALDSVKKWTFIPGMRGNENVETWVRIPIRFELE